MAGYWSGGEYHSIGNDRMRLSETASPADRACDAIQELVEDLERQGAQLGRNIFENLPDLSWITADHIANSANQTMASAAASMQRMPAAEREWAEQGLYGEQPAYVHVAMNPSFQKMFALGMVAEKTEGRQNPVLSLIDSTMISYHHKTTQRYYDGELGRIAFYAWDILGRTVQG